jgi:hypothetical protein
MHRGYFKVWRKIEDSGLYQMPNTLAMFMFLLSKAMHKDCRVGTSAGIVELKRGQYISGRAQLSADLKQTEREIRTSLSRLIELQIIDQQTTSRYSIYTIVNYDKYQDCDQKTTSTSTSKRPANDQQTTTKERIKELKNDNNSSASGDAGIIYSQSFLTFWSMYPNKKNKGAAFRAFKKIKPTEYPAIKSGLIAAKESPEWIKDNGQFIPHPSSWLNARGWEDEITESKNTIFNLEEFMRGK